MKSIFCIVSMCFLVQEMKGQTQKKQIDSHYFLLGTLSDYLGRSLYADMKDKVDYYYKFERPLALKIDSLFKSEYPDLRLDTNKIEIYSKQLAEKINALYVFEPSGTYLKLTSEHDTVYRGRHKVDIFKTDQQKMSFIAGAYTRFGEKNDTTFCMRLFNSGSKAQLCTDLLKEMKCQNVEYKTSTNTIPTNHTIYFKPNTELKEYLQEVMYLRQVLNDGWIAQIKEIIGKKNWNKYNRLTKKRNQKKLN
jgi:hypothetical protein